MPFPKDFVWGVASAAYQIEGAVSEDGRGESVWDAFCRRPNAVANGESGEDACDSYHRYAEDIALAATMGVSAYRFSISWVRIDPLGDGNINAAGLAYYGKVVDACIRAGITPYVTLFHWDLPQALEETGGWANPKTAEQFAYYARAVGAYLKGRVHHYFTLNEPECVLQLGYAWGIHAPGKKMPLPEAFAQLHGMLRGHGLSAAALRSEDPSAEIGIVTTGRLCYPATPSQADIIAARKATFILSDIDWMFTHNIVLDAVCFGHYPECSGALGDCIARIPQKELEEINFKPDLIGLNIYNGCKVLADPQGEPVYVQRERGFPLTATKWPVTPEVMRWGPRFIAERYGLPVCIAENGQSCNDRIFLDGKVHDPDRIDFLHRYLLQLRAACEDGVDLRGYFAWSLTDNFEWHCGYGERFGLIYIDYPSQRRIPKDSAHWFAQVTKTNGNALSSFG